MVEKIKLKFPIKEEKKGRFFHKSDSKLKYNWTPKYLKSSGVYCM